MVDHFDEGMNGRIYETKFGVVKVQKNRSLGHDIQTQKRIHSLTGRTAETLALKTIRIPKVHLENLNSYEMERVSTDKVIYLGDLNHGYPISDELFESIVTELAILWVNLYKEGFVAWDFELFLQPDGTVALLDFDKFGFRMTSGPVSVLFPTSKRSFRSHAPVPDIRYLFQNPCFPHDFVNRLQSLGFQPPADCLPPRKNED